MAAVEALLTLRDLLLGEVEVVLIAPEPTLIYQPLSVVEPFDPSQGRRWDLGEIVEDLGAGLRVGAVASVDAGAKEVRLHDGDRLDYDILLLAPGAQRTEWLPGSLTFRGTPDVAGMREMLEDLEAGLAGDVAFAAPEGTAWLLPLYELALLTAAWVADVRLGEVGLTVITPEPAPLHAFGAGASEAVRNLLADRSIGLVAGQAVDGWKRGRLILANGRMLRADRVVALPRLQGPGIGGLPIDGDGFILTEEGGGVRGLSDVYAAGDATDSPIKQGGLAVAQAGAIAELIAAQLGAQITPRPFRPVLRGLLLTGVVSTFMRAEVGQDGSTSQEMSIGEPLWWPAGKIAGGRLAGYLADGPQPVAAMVRKEPPGVPHRVDGEAREEVRRLALAFADADAKAADYRSALEWLDVLEQMDGTLSADLQDKRRRWKRSR